MHEVTGADEAAVDVRAVRVEVDGTAILDDVSVRFARNRFNVVLGPNGAGKSTLLKVATGLLPPSAGSVHYDHRPLSSMGGDERARRRGVLSQHVEMSFPLPVEDVVMMGRYPHFARVPAPRDREIVREALALVGMTSRRAQPYPTLSGGERQKVQLARVLAQIWNAGDAGGHALLFLDEPTTSLDVHYQLQLLDVARDLLQHEHTVVAILHDINVALEYGDRFFVLADGRLAFAADRAADVTAALIERVFRVRARPMTDAGNTHTMWRFTL
ncbi:MAG TPA: ATP-binding cassette domain-containing protein [Gemmatimonadaceae bacterium]|nr:ATP-binding cassette domain-containing protein [Gemmatimonadaceae bacterium]